MKANRNNTSKKNIIKNIFNQIGIPINYSAQIIDDLILILILNIKLNKSLKIKNFGTFFLKSKNKRIGRNQRDKIDHVISERSVVTFRAAENLKKKLDSNAIK